MARFLQDLLGAKEPLFMTAMHHLEKATGHDGIDVRLIGDIIGRGHAVLRRLGLDPADTTPHELYNALRAHAHDDGLFDETSYVGLVYDGEVISLNRKDVADNQTTEYDQRSLRHMRCQLQHEIVDRYYQHPRTDDRVVEEFARDAGLDICYNEAEHSEKHTDKEGSMNQPYILTIGDIVTDAFIKLRDDEARIDTDADGSKRLSMEFGSKPPYDHVDIIQAVGNSANASVAFARLGLRTGLMAWVGDDQPGQDSLTYLKGEGVDTAPLTVAPGMKSNYHYALRYGADRTILIKYEDYDYTWREPQTKPDWIYLSMISDTAWQLHEDLLAYLDANPDIKLVFQPGTFHFQWGAEKLADLYRRTHMVVMNREEAGKVTGYSIESVPELMRALHELGPKVVVITDGPDGSYASDGDKMVAMPNYPDPAPPYDRTGAGDAFCSTITAALAMGESLETAMTWAPINSMSVVQQLGAQAGLLRKNEINRYLQTAPADYRSQEL